MDSLGLGSAVGEKAKNGMEKEKYLSRAERSRSRRWNARRYPFPPKNVTYISVLGYFSLHKALFMVRWRSVLEGVSVRVDMYLSYLKVCVKNSKTEGNACNTPSSRLQTLKHSTCTDYRTACGERKRDKPQERSRTRVLSNTSWQKHLFLSVFSSKVLTFFSLSCLNCLWTITGKETNKDFSRRDSYKYL